MPKSAYTTALLTVIALSLAVLAGSRFSADFHIQQVSASTGSRQGWEYKRITVENFHTEDFTVFGITATRAVFATRWYEDGVQQNTELDYTSLYSRLGAQGWELAAAFPESGFVSLKQGMPQDVNGSTSQVRYIFKRPRG